MFPPSVPFVEWMIIQLIVMVFNSLMLSGAAQYQRKQDLILGSILHGSLSVILFGLWGQYIRPFFWI